MILGAGTLRICATALLTLSGVTSGHAQPVDVQSRPPLRGLFGGDLSMLRARCDLSGLSPGVQQYSGEWATALTNAHWQEGARGLGRELPAHCAIRGTIGEHIGPPGKTLYGNRFLLRVPAHWNGRLVFQGGGGNNGVVGDAYLLGKDGSTAIERGFAVLAQDSGHQGREPYFAVDAQAYRDFAHAGVHKATVIGKQLIGQLTGEGPGRSYFVGCSNGGREALVTAQRHDDFDGVVAGSPGYATYDQWLQNLSVLQTVSEVAGYAKGTVAQDTSAAYTDEQLKFVAKHFMAKCDALDGLADGMVFRPQACKATPQDWQALQCAADGGTAGTEVCLTRRQSQGLAKIYDGVRNSRGELLFPGFYPGHIETALRLTYLGQAGAKRPVGGFYDSIMTNFPFMGYGFHGYDGLTGPADQLSSYPGDARAYVANFDFDTMPQRLAQGREDFGAGNVDPASGKFSYESFRRRGGRMLVYTGTADHGVQSSGVTRLFDRLTTQYGQPKTDEMAALFLIPGMNHCRGGEATERFDPLGALVDWVELGRRPERLVAGVAPGSALFSRQPELTRPLCAYPRYARWNQRGSPASHESFECALP